MTRKPSPKLLVGIAAGVAVAGGGAALAASHFTSPKQENQAVVNDAAKQLGIEPSALSAALKKALENRIDAAVAAGRLTKDQASELKKRIEAGDVPLFAGPGFGMGHFDHGFAPFGRLDAAASYLGLTGSQLEQKLNAGKTLAEVAKAQGKSVDGLVSALYDEAKKHLDDAVSNGRLSKDQEQQILSGLKTRLQDFVDNAQLRMHRDFDGPNRFNAPNGFDGPPPSAAMPGI
jgi:polyhydroxyalkanoate synthesis regulator phasin